MKTAKDFPSWDEIIFENRNKEYGAFEIRRTYSVRLLKSMTIVLSGIIFSLLAIGFFRFVPPDDLSSAITDAVVLYSMDMPVEHKHVALPEEKPKGGQARPVEGAFLPVDTLTTAVDTTTVSMPVVSPGTADTASSSVSAGPSSSPAITDITHSGAAVDKLPEFPGGMEKFYKYLKKNIRYTDEALRAGLSVKVYVRFIVGADGKVHDIRVMQDPGYGLAESIRRALLQSPPWTAGIVRNQPVNTEMIVPFSFNIIQ